ncbi:hypothetical protein GT755_38045 [Herbidospora sp. NEAU-GS84]|uniref:Uncharacterized protein n=1 Tax=Herbidospora solisilvae TaxID=2696284 RepID=A0A7C9P395_9ACTN|nr:hypothetical protein [Herbidospora solisilvae]NAS27457.1 hypothetical protein [Herbidospora solisilvae]
MTNPSGAGIFDDDPSYERLRAIRESGYDGPLDQDLLPVSPLRWEAEALDALRRRGA